jgi:4-hydroxy-tetrahydrodipicolinate reductase
MKIALVGHGKMGKEIEHIAIERGHNIVCIIDINNTEAFESAAFRSADVVIEFTSPEAAISNYQQCFKYHLPVVTGTTGWLDKLPIIQKACEEGQTFFYASNFSLGVNLFFALNRRLAEIMKKFPDYDVSIREVHHTQKKDAPSGTAITLAEAILSEIPWKKEWINAPATDKELLPIISERTGDVPGYHEVCYDSSIDTIRISHNAKSRAGFALGAVMAAEFIVGKKGFLTMNDLLGF